MTWHLKREADALTRLFFRNIGMRVSSLMSKIGDGVGTTWVTNSTNYHIHICLLQKGNILPSLPCCQHDGSQEGRFLYAYQECLLKPVFINCPPFSCNKGDHMPFLLGLKQGKSYTFLEWLPFKTSILGMGQKLWTIVVWFTHHAKRVNLKA